MSKNIGRNVKMLEKLERSPIPKNDTKKIISGSQIVQNFRPASKKRRCIFRPKIAFPFLNYLA